jgi:ubiquinone biosynthesis protein COQ9
MADAMDETQRKDALIAALLPDVPFDGWSVAALRAAAQRIGMDEAERTTLFPRGARDAVAWFSDWADRLTLETMATRPLDGMSLADRIALGVRIRLGLLAPHREAARRGLSLLALPGNAPLGLKLLGRTVDALWHAADDRATDFSFYTKRAMLAGIYAATMLYWFDDRSEDGAATDAFLRRRLHDAMALPRLKAEFARIVGFLPNPRRFFRAARPRA